jgi:hypothetical protein
MCVKSDKFPLYCSIPRHLWIFWHLYNSSLRFATHLKVYLVKVAKIFAWEFLNPIQHVQLCMNFVHNWHGPKWCKTRWIYWLKTDDLMSDTRVYFDNVNILKPNFWDWKDMDICLGPPQGNFRHNLWKSFTTPTLICAIGTIWHRNFKHHGWKTFLKFLRLNYTRTTPIFIWTNMKGHFTHHHATI